MHKPVSLKVLPKAGHKKLPEDNGLVSSGESGLQHASE